MRARKKLDTDLSFCVSNGVKIYPIFDRSKWYIEVNNNGRKITYPKPISNSKILSGKQLQKPMEKTAKFWADKIQEIHEKISKDRTPENHESHLQNGHENEDSKSG